MPGRGPPSCPHHGPYAPMAMKPIPPQGRARLRALLAIVAIALVTSIGPSTHAFSGPGAPFQGEADGGLRRRGRIGLLFSEVQTGLLVREVVRNSPAAYSGFRPGDVITTVEGAPVRDRWSLLSRVRAIRAGDTVRLGILRDGGVAEVDVTADEVPREGDLDARAEYRAFQGRNGKLRSVWSVSAAATTGLRASVLVIRGVGAPAADAPGNTPFRDLAFHLAHQGLLVVRYDAEGVGDSEGGPSETVDFEGDVADARAALAHLRADPRVDPNRVVLLGQGTGGGVAAVVASSEKVAALVVIGTVARPLMEYATESRRAQLALAGIGPEETDVVVREHIAVFGKLVDGTQLEPGASGIVGGDGLLLGRQPRYWRQYDNAGLARVFARLAIPVMNAIGEFDFVSCLGEHRAIADALRVKNPDGQVLVVFERTDHDLRSFESREAAYAGHSAQSASANEQALTRIGDWIRVNVPASAQ
jgi:predicted alpha/beta hydrolase